MPNNDLFGNNLGLAQETSGPETPKFVDESFGIEFDLEAESSKGEDQPRMFPKKEDVEEPETETAATEETEIQSQTGEAGEETAETGSETQNQEDTQEEQEVTPAGIMHSFLVENEIMPAIEDFDGKPETLKKAMEDLPEHLFLSAVDELHPHSQVFAQYMFNLGNEGSIEQLADFFDKYYRPQVSKINLDTVEGATNYLTEKLLQTNVVANVEEATNSIDLIGDDTAKINRAKAIYEKEKQSLDEQAAKELKEQQDKKAEAKKLALKRQADIEQALKDTNWQTKRQQIVHKALNPKEIARKNDIISGSPKAIVQLADFYTYLNEETGEFDVKGWLKRHAETLNAESTKTNIQQDAFSSALGKLKSKGQGNSGKGDAKKGSLFSEVDLSDEATNSKFL